MRDDIEEEDVEEAYYRYMEENPMAGVLADEQEDLMVEYDNDGNVIYLQKNKVCDTHKSRCDACFIKKILIFFLLLRENVGEVLLMSSHNSTFSWRNKKKIFS